MDCLNCALGLLSHQKITVRELSLQRPIYLKTASYGHFGVHIYIHVVGDGTDFDLGNPEYSWEQPKKLAL